MAALPVSQKSSLPQVIAFSPSVAGFFHNVFNDPSFKWGNGETDQIEDIVDDKFKFTNIRFMQSRMYEQHKSKLLCDSTEPISLSISSGKLPEDVTAKGMWLELPFETLMGIWYIFYNVDHKFYAAAQAYLFESFPDKTHDVVEYFGIESPEPFYANIVTLYALAKNALFMGDTPIPPNIYMIYLKVSGELCAVLHRELVRREEANHVDIVSKVFSSENIVAFQGEFYLAIDLITFIKMVLTDWVLEVGTFWSINKDRYIK